MGALRSRTIFLQIFSAVSAQLTAKVYCHSGLVSKEAPSNKAMLNTNEYDMRLRNSPFSIALVLEGDLRRDPSFVKPVIVASPCLSS